MVLTAAQKLSHYLLILLTSFCDGILFCYIIFGNTLDGSLVVLCTNLFLVSAACGQVDYQVFDNG